MHAVNDDASLGESQLDTWFEKILLILQNKTTINTRRSAGLPSLLCGLLVATKTSHLIQKAFLKLEKIAREPTSSADEWESSLAQVHAMNCLKDVLKNSRLGEKSEEITEQK